MRRELREVPESTSTMIFLAAVDCVYTVLPLKQTDEAAYEAILCFGEKYTRAWGEPNLTKAVRGISNSSLK
jgi:hypothetical protein